MSIPGGFPVFAGGAHSAGSKHYHIRCLACGRIEDIGAEVFPDLDAAVRGKTDFEILSHELEFEGLCADCRKSAKRSRKRAR